jgi:diketogulonate reductase-like aldo/keto reductase
MGYKEGDELFPKNEDGTKVLLSDIHFLQTWKALEETVCKQKIRSIGVSNFNKEQIQLIWENCKIKPSVLQVLILNTLQEIFILFYRSKFIHISSKKIWLNSAKIWGFA